MPEKTLERTEIMEKLLRESQEGIASAITQRTAYFPMYQGSMTNGLAKVRGTKHKVTKDPVTEETTLSTQDGSFSFKLGKGFPETSFRRTTCQLHDMILRAYPSAGGHDRTIRISLDEYMKIRDVKGQKRAYMTMTQDANTLQHGVISFQEKRRGKNARDYINVSLFEYVKYENGILEVRFTELAAKIISAYNKQIGMYPIAMLATQNENTYQAQRTLTEHYRMNVGKANANIVTVKSLLEKMILPTIEALKASDREV